MSKRGPASFGRAAAAWLACVALAAGCEWESESPRSGPATPSSSESAPIAAATPEAEPRLNVVLITLDTVRADALGAYGQTLATSPNLDRLAAEGVLFEQASASAPSTLPSHATIMTGQFQLSHGVRGNAGYVLPDDNVTLAETFRARGYRTAAEVAAPVLGAKTGIGQGFDRFRDLDAAGVERIRTEIADAGGPARTLVLEERAAEDITRSAKIFITRNRQRPFFLWLHYFDPHELYLPRREFQAQLPNHPYHAEILYTDQQIGRLIRHIEELGLRERTLVVIVSDHGEGLGEHGEESHAYYLYESTLRVPLLFWGPERLPAGLRVGALVRTADVAPTVLALAGIPAPPEMHGTSLLPLMSGERDDLDLPAYGESVEIAALFDASVLRSLRLGAWKYVHQIEPELYDIGSDPGETRNLASARPEKVAEMRERLERLVAAGAATPDDAAVVVDQEVARRLQALGYVAVGDTAKIEAQLSTLEVRGPAPPSLAEDIDRYATAMGMADRGFHGKAEPALGDLAERYPNRPMVLLSYSWTLKALGRKPEARRALEGVLALTPCSLPARLELGELLGELADYPAQVETLRHGVDDCPESYELLNNYAYVVATVPDHALRDGAAAVRAAERAANLTGRNNAGVLDTLAAAHAEAGEFERAVAVSERAVRLAEEQGYPQALRTLFEESLARYLAGEPMRAP
jgi:arylsulfatase A-like enzyme